MMKTIDYLPLKQRLLKPNTPWSRLLIVGVHGFLCVLLVFLLAKLSWRVYELFFIHSQTKYTVVEQVNTTNQSIDTVDLNVLGIATNVNKMSLFGKLPEKVQSKTTKPVLQDTANLPKTGLALTLTGLLASSDQTRAMAIIKYQNKQNSYFVGDVIASQAKIVRIEPTGVMIDENGKLTLLSYKDDLTASAVNHTNRSSPPIVEESPSDGQVSTELKEELLASPQRLFDFIAIAPVKEGDELVGYRINPGKEAEMFTQLGFMPGDIAVEINGVSLKDEVQSLGLLGELPNMTELSINVEREGQIYTINLSLSE